MSFQHLKTSSPRITITNYFNLSFNTNLCINKTLEMTSDDPTNAEKHCTYSWTSLCRSVRDSEKYFDIGMVRDNQLDIMGSETFWQNISFKKNAYLQASFYHY